MTDHALAASRALRLMSAALDDDHPDWSIDAITRVLLEVDACPGCRTDLILTLLDAIVHPISCSQHRDHWRTHIERQLAEVLDELGAVES